MIGQQIDRGPSLGRDECLDNPGEIRRNQEALVARKAMDALDQEKQVRKQRVRELVTL